MLVRNIIWNHRCNFVDENTAISSGFFDKELVADTPNACACREYLLRIIVPKSPAFDPQVPLDPHSGRLAYGSKTTAEIIPLLDFPFIEGTINSNGIVEVTCQLHLGKSAFVTCVLA